ncbi:MAG TPA: glycosyltransferase family 39 protein, partial [Anaerolineae bacterium]|nr:glycosyltransferase family 39 protein [Anaerolineae bacterium]
MLTPSRRIGRLSASQAIWLSLLGAGVLWLILLAAMHWQPILADEVQVYLSAVNWPNGPMRVNPPVYIYAIQLAFRLFGQSVDSARLPGIVGGYATLCLIPIVTLLALGKTDRARWTAVIAIWLYALSPIAVQNMMILGIDNSLLTPAMLALVAVWLKMEPRPTWQRVLFLTLALALTLWVKLLSPILTMGAIGLYYLLRGQFKRMLEVAAATALGLVLFWLTIQIDVTHQYLFGYTGGQLSRLNILVPGNVQFMATTFPQVGGIFALWLSLPLALLIFIAVVRSIGRWIKHRAGVLDGLAMYATLASIAYALVIYPAWGYPYYHTPFVPLLIILAAEVLTPALEQLPRPAWLTLGITSVVAFLYSLIVVGDPLLRLYLLTFETLTAQVGARLQQGLRDVLRIALPIPVAMIFGWFAAPRLRVKRSQLLLALLGALALAALAGTTLTQVSARYSTRYRYGYNYDDMLRAVARVRDYVGPQGFVAALDDVLFYTGLNGEGIYGMATQLVNWQDNRPSLSLLDLLRQRRVDALVWTTKE